MRLNALFRLKPPCTIRVLHQRTKDMKKLLSTAAIIAALAGRGLPSPRPSLACRRS